MFKQWLDKTWPGKQAARVQWDAGLAWFRLRYLTPDGPTRCIRLLSRPQACGRVALYFRPDESVSELFLGIPDTHIRLLLRMAADFGFLLKPKLSEVSMPTAQRLTAVSQLPWERPFLAHVVNEFLFVSPVDGRHQGKTGRFLPQPQVKVTEETAGQWQLPPNPPPGLTAQPNWRGQLPPAHLMATEANPGRWLLGRAQTGIPLHVSGRVNIYGRAAAVADWLVYQATQTVSLDPANLVILDGAGDLMTRLKRKAAVTRLLGDRLTYIDMDGMSLAGGFNPLAAIPGESEADLLARWQRWFGGMNVPLPGIQLLALAQTAGVADIPALRKWLKQVERQGQTAAVSSLSLALNRLTANRSVREWLDWPVDRFDILPAGALFFACKSTSWERQQLLRAVLLVAASQRTRTILLHGYPWSAFGVEDVSGCDSVLISNGPPLPGAAAVLVQAEPTLAAAVGQRYLNGDGKLVEGLQLLQPGEGLVVAGGEWFFTSWERRWGGLG